jgi:hypothetical protein
MIKKEYEKYRTHKVKLEVVRRKCLGDCKKMFDGDKQTFVCKKCKNTQNWSDGAYGV